MTKLILSFGLILGLSIFAAAQDEGYQQESDAILKVKAKERKTASDTADRNEPQATFDEGAEGSSEEPAVEWEGVTTDDWEPDGGDNDEENPE